MDIPSTVSPLSVEDLPALRTFVFDTHVESSSYSAESRAQQLLDLPDDFPDLLTPESFTAVSLGSWVVRDSSGGIIGASGLKRGASPSEMWLSYLFVSPAARGRGVGRALLVAALERAQTLASALAPSGAGLHLLTLEGVYAQAVALYESYAFETYRRVPLNPATSPFYTLLYMKLDLVSGTPEAPSGSEASASASPAASLEPTVTVARGESPPLKVLVLHGYSQNGPDFLARYKPLLDRKLKFCTLVAPSAPFPLASPTATPAQRTWWYNRAPDPTRGGVLEGLDTSRALLLRLVAEQGPFSGVLGFSQGAVLAHQLLAEGSLPGCKWCVLASGFPSPQAPAQAPLLPLPSLHLSSASDSTVAAELHANLAARFLQPRLILHEHGHALVQKAEHCNAVVDFIKQYA
jgi:GNAT superfamily N-acetyltransferase/predicted esterase